MFEGQSIKVLIADNDPVVARMCARVIESMHLTAIIVYTIEDTLTYITAPKKPSILLLARCLNGGAVSADVVLDTWIANALGPVAVICDTITPEIEIDLITRGAYNILVKPFGATLLQGLLNRYAREIADQRVRVELLEKIARLEGMVADLTDTNRKIKKWALGLAFAVAAVGGIELLPYLKGLVALLF